MKARYEALELNIVKIPVEDTIMMRSGLLGQRFRGSI